MHVVARLRKVAPRKLVRLNEHKDLCINHGAQRFDSIPHKRIAPVLI
jgi:hypothetical protein